MDFTFGIITSGGSDSFIERIIKTIKSQNIPNYEIIIVGQTLLTGDNVRVIEFDETIKPKWITRKKNLICQNAIYENIVLLHDYIELEDGWYSGFLKYGNNFDICNTRIVNNDGTRFRDFVLFNNGLIRELNNILGNRTYLPYDTPINKINKIMYISGSYYIVKRSIALKFPLNEELCWNQGEDVVFSHTLRSNNILLKCNTHSSVKLLKQKEKTDREELINPKDLQILNSMSLDTLSNAQYNHQQIWTLEQFKIRI